MSIETPGRLPAVVFDTNVCRELTGAKLAAVLDRERVRGVGRFIDPWVLLELLAHVADEADRSYPACRAALKGLWTRVGEFARGGDGGGILRDSESEVSRLITGRRSEAHQLVTMSLATLWQMVAQAADGEPLSEQQSLSAIATFVDEKEREYAELLRKNKLTVAASLARQPPGMRRVVHGITRRMSDRADVVRDTFARQLIQKAYQDVELPVPERASIDAEAVKRLREMAAVGLEFYAQIVRKVVFDDINLDAPRNRNLMWDNRIAYIVGQTVDGAPVWLITNDPAFREAAQPVGFGDRVLTLAGYQDWLQRA